MFKGNSRLIHVLSCIVLISAAAMVLLPQDAAAKAKKYKYSVTVKQISAETVLPPGSTYKLSCKGTKKKGKVKKSAKLAFKSSNTQIATVSTKGVITAKKNGVAKITVYCKDKKSAKKTVSVWVGQRITNISIAGYSRLRIGRKVSLTAVIEPAYASNQNIIWSSSSPGIVYVSKTGKITAMKEGTAVIKAKAADGSKKSRSITVISYRLRPDDARWVAHRGLPTNCLENTVKAFTLAGSSGFWGAECDIWETKRGDEGDFDLVVNHDATFSRVFGKDLNVWDVNAADIHDTISPEVCFLRDYLSVCKQYSMVPMIDIKVSDDGEHTLTEEGVEKMFDVIEEVYGTAEAAGLMDRNEPYGKAIRFNSYSIDVFRRIKACAETRYGTVPYLGMNVDQDPEAGIAAATEEPGLIAGINIKKNTLTKEIYENCASHGIRVNTWSYNDNAAGDEYLYRDVVSGEFDLDTILVNAKVFD